LIWIIYKYSPNKLCLWGSGGFKGWWKHRRNNPPSLSLKMLLKPVILQHFRKQCCCASQTAVPQCTVCDAQQLFSRNCCRTTGLSNTVLDFFRADGHATDTNNIFTLKMILYFNMMYPKENDMENDFLMLPGAQNEFLDELFMIYWHLFDNFQKHESISALWDLYFASIFMKIWISG
jgi:hypothetical protein